MAEILPEVAAMKGVEQPPEYHPEGDVWVHTLLLLEDLEQPTPTLALGALLHDVGKPPTFRVAERIRFDGHVEAGVQLAHEHPDAAALLARGDGAGRGAGGESHALQGRGPDEAKHAEALSAPAALRGTPGTAPAGLLSSNRRLENYELVKQQLEELPEEHLKPAPLLTGADLIAEGYEPGPIFTRILSAVEDAQLEGRIHTSGEALAMVLEAFPPGRN